MKLFTVILHYGDPDMTQSLARELEAGRDSVCVLDNAAPLPYDARDKAAWLRLPDNLFWAGALEVALEQAAAQGATHVWFCNNDIRCLSAPPYVSRIAARLRRMESKLGRVGVWAPSVSRNPYHPQMVQRPGVVFSRVSYVDGIAPVIALDCAKAVGGVDAADNPRGYGVDVWLSLRAHRAGWPVVVDHEILLRHDYHTTAKEIPGFMSEAAAAEDLYMTARMGRDWREQMRALQREQDDEVAL